MDRAGAEYLTFVFVGAGYAGVEALGELADLVRDALRHYPSLRDAPTRWVLVDAAPKILPEVPSRLGDYAAGNSRGEESRSRVDDARAVEPARRRRSRRRAHPHHTLVWTTGVSPNRLLAELGLPARRARRASRSTPSCESKARGSLGARRLRTRAQPCDDGRARSADVPARVRQARRLAKNLSGTPRPTVTAHWGRWRHSAGDKGIADVFGLPLRGFLGWFVTRTYHLYQLPLLSRKLRVVADWTVSLLFRRDIAELSMLGHPKRLGDD